MNASSAVKDMFPHTDVRGYVLQCVSCALGFPCRHYEFLLFPTAISVSLCLSPSFFVAPLFILSLSFQTYCSDVLIVIHN